MESLRVLKALINKALINKQFSALKNKKFPGNF